MNIVVPDELLRGTAFDPGRALLDLAVGLYADSRATLGQAAEVAGLSQTQFLRELGRRSIPIHYGPDELKEDLQTVETLAQRQ